MVTEVKHSTVLDVSKMGHSGVLEILLKYPELEFNLPTAPDFYREVRTYFIGMMNGLIAKANVFDLADCETIQVKQHAITQKLNQCAVNHCASRAEIHAVAAEISSLEDYIDNTIAALPPMDYPELKARVQMSLEADVDFKMERSIREPFAELEGYLLADDENNLEVMRVAFDDFLDGASHALAKFINLVQSLIDQQRQTALENGIYHNPVVHMQFMRHEKRLKKLLSGRDIPRIMVDLNELASLIDKATVQQQLLDHLLVGLRERFNAYQATIAEFDIADCPVVAEHVEGLKTQFNSCFLPTTVQRIEERLDDLAVAMQTAKALRENEIDEITTELTHQVTTMQAMLETQAGATKELAQLQEFATALQTGIHYTELCQLQTVITEFSVELENRANRPVAEQNELATLQGELTYRLHEINSKAQAHGCHREISELLANSFSAVVDIDSMTTYTDVLLMVDELAVILDKLVDQSADVSVLMARLNARQAIFQYQQAVNRQNGSTEIVEATSWSGILA
ncbi:hypothetical protein EQG49_11410 [Periweissella cryptocerci]|uniref:Uncharacterized protein n=1 Tax=Periweissella cryptocerci TaxID=2506420 RepID=A0A4P6YW12_9LACO|nr:hypothetical protein [Periweissella cryptocerci]QBO37014.1 hypothetical protein EQG49_11410 [Periweissella cryptocerci]